MFCTFPHIFPEIVHTGHKCGLNRPHYPIFHLNYNILKNSIINDERTRKFLRHTYDITLVQNYLGLLFKKVVNRNITPSEQKQVEYALTHFQIKMNSRLFYFSLFDVTYFCLWYNENWLCYLINFLW